MKKTIILLAIVASSLFSNEMFLVEDYVSGDVEFDPGPDVTVATVSFTVDREAMISISIGGPLRYDYTQGSSNIHPAIYGCSWISMNGIKQDYSVGSPEVNGSFVFTLEPGSYQFELKINAMNDNIFYYKPPDYTETAFTIHNPRIQALVILSDTAGGAVAESPPEYEDPHPRSLVASGPSVSIPGCLKLSDIAGRTVDCEINDDRIMISSLPKGTYFAQTSDQRTIKIVKM
jgi:hypothetical protein